jgi:hypothetical protein
MRTRRREIFAAALLLTTTTLLLAKEASSAKGVKNLPPGGGEPGKAYLDYFAAIEKGDVAAIKKMKLPEIEGWDDDALKVWIVRMRDDVPKKVKVTGGTQYGDSATLLVTAETIGKPSWGRVEMKKTDGVWRKTDAKWSLEGPVK